MKPTTNKLYGLDHLRAFAISFVFIFHYGRLFAHPQWVEAISEFGWTGVDLFFVLSGYLIASQLFAQVAANKPISFRLFFLKRFFRIIPAFLVVLSLYFLFPSFHEREALAPLWKYLSFTQNLGLDISRHGTFSHDWSLCIEEQFYLFFPLLLIALYHFRVLKRGYWLLVLLFLFGFAARLYAWNKLVWPFEDSDDYLIHWYKWIYYPTYSRLDGLLTGVGLAALFQFRPAIKTYWQRWGNYSLLAGLLLLAGAYFLCRDPYWFGASVFGFPLVSIGYGFIVAGAVSPGSILFRFCSVITSRLATLSYALYLVHKITTHLTQVELEKLGIAKDSNLMMLLCIVTSLAGAWLLNVVVEKPFLLLREKVIS